MKFQEYVPLAVRTAKPLNTTVENVGHAVLGLLTEVDELAEAIEKGDDVNIAEELADKAWYIALLTATVGVDFDFLTEALKQDVQTDFAQKVDDVENPYELQFGFIRIASAKLDIIKKLTIYGKEVSPKEASEAVLSIYLALEIIFETFAINVEDALLKNVRKLAARYPDLYTDDSALNRNLEAERKELEGDAD